MVVLEFQTTFNIKFDKATFRKQLGLANRLLKDHDLLDLMLVMFYLREYPLRSRLQSVWYLSFIIDDILPKAKAWQKEKEDKQKTDFSVEEQKIEKIKFERKRRFTIE